jgi:hypothetical protein
MIYSIILFLFNFFSISFYPIFFFLNYFIFIFFFIIIKSFFSYIIKINEKNNTIRIKIKTLESLGSIETLALSSSILNLSKIKN